MRVESTSVECGQWEQDTGKERDAMATSISRHGIHSVNDRSTQELPAFKERHAGSFSSWIFAATCSYVYIVYVTLVSLIVYIV